MWYINFSLAYIFVKNLRLFFKSHPRISLKRDTFGISGFFKYRKRKSASNFTKIVSLINVDVVVIGPCFGGI